MHEQVALELDFGAALDPVMESSRAFEVAPVATLVPSPPVYPDLGRSWCGSPPVGFDLETTGPEPLEARIVQAAIVDASATGAVHEWLVDPEMEIPEGAVAVHGITTELARADGRRASVAVAEIAATLTGYWAEGRAVVIYNAQYDLTVLASELARHGLPPLEIGCVVDPLVIWREKERYRKGKKRLSDAAERFGVAPGDAHDATSDARAAIGVALAVCELGELDQTPVDELMRAQAAWHRAWASNFADWLRQQGGDASDVNLEWPIRLGGSGGAAL